MNSWPWLSWVCDGAQRSDPCLVGMQLNALLITESTMQQGDRYVLQGKPDGVHKCLAPHLDHAVHTACHKVLQVGAGSHTDHPGSVAAPVAAALLPLGGARAPYQALGQIQQPDCTAGVAQQGGTVQKVQAGQLQSRSKQWMGKGQSGTGQGVSGAAT